MSSEAQDSSEAAAGGAEPTVGEVHPLFVNVNGRKVGVAESGEIVTGPPAMKGKWVAPSQMTILNERKDYHGHLLLSDTQDQTRLAEAELSLMTGELNVRPEDIRPGMMVTYQGVGGRIEDIAEGGRTVSISLAGVVRPIPVEKLIRDADFHVTETEAAEAELALSDDEKVALLEAAGLDEEPIAEPTEDATHVDAKMSDEVLEALSDEDLMSHVQLCMEIVERRKAEETSQ